MPALIGWVLRLGGKLLSGWVIPFAAVAMAWVIEQFTGAVSWGLFEAGSALLRVLLEAILAFEWPEPIVWGSFSATATGLLQIAGVLAAIQVVVLAGVARLVVKIVSLGRF